MADGNTLLNDKTLEMPVALRMNRNCMVFIRGNYFLEIKALQPLKWPLWFLVSKRPKEHLKRPEFLPL
jgi:hypothetical protein